MNDDDDDFDAIEDRFHDEAVAAIEATRDVYIAGDSPRIEPVFTDAVLTVYQGDNLEVLPELEANSVHAIVTDPPYGIGFMGHEWDQPGAYASTRSMGSVRSGGESDLDRQMSRAQRRATHRLGSGAAHASERAARRFVGDHTKTSERSTSMEAGRYDLSPSANRKYQAWCEAWGRELIRVAKPGAHLLSFGGTRTVHRLTAGLEDAGWEIRDVLVWGYASGFPKSLDTERAIATTTCLAPGRHFARRLPDEDKRLEHDHVCEMTPESEPWDGWGTALKPAWEPIVLARRPFVTTIARNALEHATGSLNVDGTRIGMDEMPSIPGELGAHGIYGKMDRHGGGAKGSSGFVDGYEKGSGFVESTVGRWPANIVLTDPIFDSDEGVVGGGDQVGGGFGTENRGKGTGIYGAFSGATGGRQVGYGDAGSYSRFFLISKAASSDREPVVTGQVERATPPGWSSGPESPGTFQSQPTPARENVHPTVKPVELMRHLVRLVTPPGGIVLDPFLGSGTTLVAAEGEGFRGIGIERDESYIAIARARLLGIQRGLGMDAGAPTPKRRTSRSHWPARRGAHKPTDDPSGFGFTGQTELEERTEPAGPGVKRRKPHNLMGSPWPTSGTGE